MHGLPLAFRPALQNSVNIAVEMLAEMKGGGKIRKRMPHPRRELHFYVSSV